MENDFSKHLVYGNYLGQSSECFPLDCETLAALQSDIRKFAALALLAGCDCLILSGCEYDRENLSRGEGYVFLRNAGNPLTGEIFYHPKQEAFPSCSISEITDSVTANGTLFPDAYVTRYLKEGGSEFQWKDFKNVKDISNVALKSLLETEIQEREQAATDFKTEILNTVETKTEKIKFKLVDYNTKVIPKGWYFPVQEMTDIHYSYGGPVDIAYFLIPLFPVRYIGGYKVLTLTSKPIEGCRNFVAGDLFINCMGFWDARP